jgi:hypothetical protein
MRKARLSRVRNPKLRSNKTLVRDDKSLKPEERENKLPQKRKGAKKAIESFLCAFAPLRETFFAEARIVVAPRRVV